GLMGMVLGVSLMFFITTVPFERLVLAVMGLVAPRVTYFARRNVSRGKTRNTLIALLVLFSAVLPSFLGTQAQLELANNETRAKMQFGAPVKIESFSKWGENVEPFTPSFVHEDVAAISGIHQVVGLSNPYQTQARDLVGFRWGQVNVLGVDGDLAQVVFNEMMEFTAGGPESLQTILAHPNTVIISEGLAEYLAVGVGDTIELQGKGLDHLENAIVVGIARRIPGIEGITRSRIEAQNISTVLVSMPHYTRLVTELDDTLPGQDAPLLGTVLATLTPDANPDKIAETLYERNGEANSFWVNMLAWQLDEGRGNMMFFVILLLALTAISFTTAVFAVFAVIYVTIYARRIEIGMLKAMGMLRRELNGMLMVEAIAMTMGSAFAGIAAGASMAYLNYYVDAMIQQMPVQFAVDKIATPAIIIMVVLASILAAAFSARRIVRKRAVEILRMN
ncbi:MAG TPA: ABC transporter permease, partial [Anaerolineales bacterium]|nr:ABC transporter permease [Anaerolineales bacterium]